MEETRVYAVDRGGVACKGWGMLGAEIGETAIHPPSCLDVLLFSVPLSQGDPGAEPGPGNLPPILGSPWAPYSIHTSQVHDLLGDLGGRALAHSGGPVCIIQAWPGEGAQ